jgi:hypothetical protein
MMTLAQEVMDVKTRLEHLEAVIRRLTGDTYQAGAPIPTTPLDQTELLAWLRRTAWYVIPPQKNAAWRQSGMPYRTRTSRRTSIICSISFWTRR